MVLSAQAYWLPDTINWGDIFTPFLFYDGFGVELNHTCKELAEVFSCGSVIEKIPNGFGGHVLGSGIGFEYTTCDLRKVQEPLLLRGQLTADRCELSKQRVRFGDPAILASVFSSPHIHKAHRYGIVPHYVDRKHQDVLDWRDRAYIIDIEAGMREVIHAIASCEMIVSSSLHGLVVADSLGIPSKWVTLSRGVLGGGFKFRDYYSAYGERDTPCQTIEEGFKYCRTHDVEPIKKDVLSVFLEYIETLK